MKRTTTLASADAAISARLGSLIGQEMEQRAISVLSECLGATTRVRSSTGDGNLRYAEAPDFAIRLAAAVKVLEFSRGRPATTAINAHIHAGGITDRPDLAAIVRKNPELAEKALRAFIERTRADHAKAVSAHDT